MVKDRDLRLALGAMAAVAGIGFATGQELVLFFGQLGRMKWLAALISAGLFAVIVYITAVFARKSGARSLPGMFQRVIGGRCGDAAGVLYGLLTALAAAMMLKTCGEIGALSLPVKNGYLCGMLMALLISVALAAGRMRALPMLGLVSAAAAVLFYGALFIDRRPVQVNMRVETVLRLDGSLWGAVGLGILHACLNGAVAGAAVAGLSGISVRPVRAAAGSGGMMLVCLLSGCLALERGGEGIMGQTLPTVLLAARWGIAGFYICAGFMYFSCLCSLTGALGAFFMQLCDGSRQRRNAAVMLLMAFLFAWALGTDHIISFGYPLLGWICAFSMAALACWRDVSPEVSAP